MRQHANEKPGPDVERIMSRKNEAGSADETSQHERDSDIQSRSKLIIEAEKAKEHQRTSHADGMHTYLVKDIADPTAADGQKRAEQEMNGHSGNMRQVFEDDPAPPIKSHADDIGDHPVLFGPKHDGIYKPEPPHQENGEYRQEGAAKNDIDKSQDLIGMGEPIEGIWMKKDQERHHIGVYEQRMKNIGDQMGDPSQQG